VEKTVVFRVFFVICLSTVLYLSFIPDYKNLPYLISISDMANHFFAFFTLSFLLDFSFEFNKSKKAFGLFVLAIGIEVVQHYLPTREFSIKDIIVDLGAIAVYYSLKPIPLEHILRNTPFVNRFFK
jgi:VanZ family protein